MVSHRVLIIVLVIMGTLVISDAQNLQRSTARSNNHEKRARSSRDLVKAYDRAEAGANIFKAIMDAPKDNTFPQVALDAAQAIAVFPAQLKYSSLTGHKGSGLVSTRDPQTGLWQPPIFINISGESVYQYMNGNSDLILFALNRDAMKAFFIDNFKLDRALTSLELLNAPIEELSARFNFIAYLHNQESLSIANIENSTIEHDGALNFAVYGERKQTHFLPTSRPISNRVLVFPETLNHYTRKL